MSVVACRVLEGRGFVMAADSILVRGWTQDTDKQRRFSKLVEINGIVIGGVGTAEELSLLQVFCATTKPRDATEYAILEFLSEFSTWKKNKASDGKIENSYLIGYDGRVFSVNGWFVSTVLSFEAIGAGMDFALAAMYLGATPKEAVEAAIKLSVYCEPPVQVISKA